uniref:Neuronal acetylcholine receptor subunit alpha-10-like n=1 Tax=Saccoglossus kowalevskii TaxID=10224 RepID=A0ABM0MGS5_SACKO|nr:PREDICTED: neuronal acetylcholine receptor subunit alpha-10-like [Saccoglossus kowalevskii]
MSDSYREGTERETMKEETLVFAYYVVIVLASTATEACLVGEVFDPNLKKCISCEICREFPYSPFCDECNVVDVSTSNRLPPDCFVNPSRSADAHDYAESIKASNCLVQHNGWVSLWSRPTVLKSTCKIDVKYFPFDKQQCRLKFGSWTYNGEQINLNQHAVKPDLTNLVPNEQWDLLYAITTRHSMRYECCPDTYHDVTFLVGLERKPLYYIYNLIMPCVLLSALSLLGFFMPYDVVL